MGTRASWGLKLNGRMFDGWSGYGELEEKYKVSIDNDIVKLYHWGTKTLEIDTAKQTVLDIYGESVSDRDSVNYMLSRFGIPFHVHYYPSREEFELHDDENDSVTVVI